jgi:FAD/FMN-containing dehydrogenase/Fe-S oxidoreductase
MPDLSPQPSPPSPASPTQPIAPAAFQQGQAGGVAVALTVSDDALRAQHANRLSELIRGSVRFGAHDRLLYATDASIYQVEPLGAVVPADTDDAIAALRYCLKNRLPVLPRGGGTSLGGQCTNRAVVLDLSSNCRGIDAVDAERRTCRVEAGITVDDLNDALVRSGHDLLFAPDPATARQATVAGCIGNNAAGTRSVMYGRTAENLESVQLVTASGTVAELGPGTGLHDPEAQRLGLGVIDIVQRYEPLIRQRFPKTLRRNAGFALDMMLMAIDAARREGVDPLAKLNLAHLVCGAEGTLGMVTRATLRLHPRPKSKGLAVLGFADLDQAIAQVPGLLAIKPAAVELLDDLIVGLARRNNEYRAYVEYMPQPSDGPLKAVLYVELFAPMAGRDGQAYIERGFEQIRRLLEREAPGAGMAALVDPEPIAQSLKLRKAGEPLLHAIPGSRKPLGFVEDNAVPVERLSEFVRRFRAIIEREGTQASFYAHASVGVLHVRPLLDLRDPEDCQRMERIATEAAALAKELGGVMSGEHGDGKARGPLLEAFYGPELMQAFREVKALFDPEGLFNPGNIVAPGPIESIHQRTRISPAGEKLKAHHVSTHFDYALEGGFDHAVELCNGAGVCRKKQGGTMCPSYMGTLDERHATRGRGNALRMAITGQVGDGQVRDRPVWNDPETLATLDLCLSCKACKTECPSNVDIATYKAEYLAQSYAAAGGPPLKARVFSNVRSLNRLGSAFAPLSNWVAESAVSRAIASRVLGLSPKRTLPRFERALPRAMDRAQPAINAGLSIDAPSVLLFGDCFVMYNEPGIGLAAARLLNAFGYRVALADAGCCGRTHVSMGMLDQARTVIDQTAARLARAWDAQHDPRAILVAEPSCLSAIADEWLKLKLPENHQADHAARGALAKRSMLVEQFLDRHWDQHPVRPAFHRPAGRAILHGHCHQKALWGADSSAALLRRIYGPARVAVLDTGCCGMAGSFGYTADHYELSMRIGELALMPAARAIEEGDTLVAPGTSCRHQIHDGAGTQAVHPVVLAASLLA